MAPKRLEPSRMARIGMPHEDGATKRVSVEDKGDNPHKIRSASRTEK